MHSCCMKFQYHASFVREHKTQLKNLSLNYHKATEISRTQSSGFFSFCNSMNFFWRLELNVHNSMT